MFDTIALNSPVLRVETTTTPAPRKGFVAMFQAALEALVRANTTRFDETGPLMYRYPPI
jgi:hypothetical protein